MTKPPLPVGVVPIQSSVIAFDSGYSGKKARLMMATISDVTAIQVSGVTNLDALLGTGPAWNYLTPNPGNVLYFTFTDDGVHTANVSSVSVLTASQQSSVRSALQYVASVSGLSFVETLNASQAQFAFLDANILTGATTSGLTNWASSYSYTLGNVITAYDADAEIFLDTFDFPENFNLASGSSGYETLLHEIGHSLGLKHPFEGSVQLPTNLDNTSQTLMSYTHVGGVKSAFQALDLDALWWIYGGDGLRGTRGINSSLGPSVTPGADPVDVTAPEIVAFDPVDGATEVGLNPLLSVTFSEEINRGSGTIVLKRSDGNIVETFDASTSIALGVSGRVLTVDPIQPLVAGLTYVLEIPQGLVRDLAGNGFAGSSQYDFTTLTLDTTVPTISSFSPVSSASAVAVGSNFVLNFSEVVIRGSGELVLQRIDGVVIEQFDMMSSSRIGLSGATLTIDPISDLEYGRTYNWLFPTGMVLDVAGNASVARSDYQFSTVSPPDTKPPEIRIFSPADESVGVARNASITLIYDETVSRGEGELLLRKANGDIVERFDVRSSARMSFSGTTLSIDPSVDLQADTAYFLDLPAGMVRDAVANPSAAVTTYNFRTAVAPDTVAPVAVNFSPASGTTDIAPREVLEVVFSEPVQVGSGAITLLNSDRSVWASYDIAANTVVSIVANVLLIAPLEALPGGHEFIVRLPAGVVLDLAGNKNALDESYAFATLPVGTDTADVLTGGPRANVLHGAGGNDVLTGLAGDDQLEGGDGLDEARFSGDFANYSVVRSGSAWLVSDLRQEPGKTGEGVDTLLDIERLRFADSGVALDLEGNAGSVAKLLGAIFGAPSVGRSDYVATGLRLLDGEEMDEIALTAFALVARLGPGYSVHDEIVLLYQNLVGREPSDGELIYWSGLVANGTYSPESLAWMASSLAENLENIGYSGLMESGLNFDLWN